MKIDPQHYPIIVAGFGLALIPLFKWLWNHYWTTWAENRNARLQAAITAQLAGYVTEETLDVKLDALTDHTDKLHEQNKAFLGSIKEDGKERQGLILGHLQAVQEENRSTAAQQTKAIEILHGRVDQLLLLSGERRQQR